MSAATIQGVGTAFPDHYYTQAELAEALRERWASRHHNVDRLEQLHRNTRIEGRHLALALEDYDGLETFTEANDAYVRVAVELGERAIDAALAKASCSRADIDHIFFVSTTGIATPSIDARLVNRMGLKASTKRSPLFGLGCVAGAVGITRASDYLRAFPEQVAVLVSVELCSLTLQRGDLSIPNIIASGLFGDGAAAVVLSGAARGNGGPRVVATRSFFYPDTERVMGWDVTGDGFRIVLSADVPTLVGSQIGGNVSEFLSDAGVALSDIETFVCHPGGPKVLDALAEALEITERELSLTHAAMKRVGNVSSASVLVVLADTLSERSPSPGSYGLMLAMGPGFCAELVLLQW